MELVDCTKEYWEFVRELRTNEQNTIWFYTQPKITSQEQEKFMNNNSHKYKICLIDGIPSGYIGIINNNEITYCVKPKFKNMGIGTFMVSEFIKLYDELIAFVIPENLSSCKVFEKLGFEKQIFFKYKKK
jgi:RimJ/RimL family protein N-acetyltransferase